VTESGGLINFFICLPDLSRCTLNRITPTPPDYHILMPMLPPIAIVAVIERLLDHADQPLRDPDLMDLAYNSEGSELLASEPSTRYISVASSPCNSPRQCLSPRPDPESDVDDGTASLSDLKAGLRFDLYSTYWLGWTGDSSVRIIRTPYKKRGNMYVLVEVTPDDRPGRRWELEAEHLCGHINMNRTLGIVGV
jgi:hypothetical protein